MPHSAKSSDFASHPMQSETSTERREPTMTPERIQYTAKLRGTHRLRGAGLRGIQSEIEQRRFNNEYHQTVSRKVRGDQQ
jgi:hypothetical protein